MISLANKYRPTTFEDVLGQDSVVKILKRQIEVGDIKNAYLFSGSSGSGKTSVARIFAKVINNGEGLPIEIDAASNSGVDNVRSIIKAAGEKSISSKYKVFIIDEVQSISNTGWQAFLKCIEEPPALTIFIFCTTDPQKIPETILNRVQRFNFKKLPSSLILSRLEKICELENFSNYRTSIEFISKIVDGCMREALTLLDKVASNNRVFNLEDTLDILGVYSYNVFCSLINYMLDGKTQEVLKLIDSLCERGGDLKVFVNQLLQFVVDVAKYILFKDLKATKIPDDFENSIKDIINFDNPITYYNYLMDRLLDLKNMIKTDVDLKTTVEVVCLQITRMQ